MDCTETTGLVEKFPRVFQFVHSDFTVLVKFLVLSVQTKSVSVLVKYIMLEVLMETLEAPGIVCRFVNV